VTSWGRGAAFAALLAATACGGGGGHAKAPGSSSSTVSPASAGNGSCTPDDRFDDGNAHVLNGTDVHYAVQPPAGGTHWQSPAAPGVYGPEEIPPQGAVVHALEHGYVAIWYRVGLSKKDVTAITKLGHELQPDALVVPQKALSVPVAATAWHHRLLCTKVDLAPIRRFVEQWRNQGPERIAH